MSSPASPARLAALEITKLVRERSAYANELIETQLYDRPTELSAQDRNFAILLIRGVVATSGELDLLLDLALPKGKIKPRLRDALRISAYELYFLDKPAHVAISQGVELVRAIQPYASGFANQLLRSLAAMKADFPFGDAAANIEALAHKEAFPPWLARRLNTDLGFEATAEFMRASNEPAPLFLAELATGKTIKDTAADLPAYLRRIKTGELLVADASAQAVAAMSTPPSADAFLEVGSGRGTKTALLYHNARRAGIASKIYALDLHGFKQELLQQRIELYKLDGVRAVTGDALKLADLMREAALPSQFGAALIDAPCSGSGTLRRHPEIRWRLRAQEVTQMAAQGLELLKSVAAHIAGGGFVVYATCSVLREENEQVIEDFLASDAGAGFVLESAHGGASQVGDGSLAAQLPQNRGDAQTAQLPQTEFYYRSRLTPGSADAHFAAKLVKAG